MFNRSKPEVPKSKPQPLTALTPVLSCETIIGHNRRQTIVDEIKTHMAWPESEYTQFVSPVLHHFINYCQQLPESQISFYGHQGGMLDYALNRCDAAMEIFKSYLIADDQGGYSDIQRLWQYALYSAALLKGIGKLQLDFTVKTYDGHGHFLSDWNPLVESLASKGKHYLYHFEKNTDEAFRRRLNLLIARQIMPVAGFNWIASNPEVLAIWLALLHEDPHSAGTLGAVLINSDAIAIKRFLHRLSFGGSGSGGRSMGRIAAFSHKNKNQLVTAEQEAGIAFIEWIKNGLATGALMINKPPLLAVPGGVIILSDAFKYFVRESASFKNWQAVEKGLLSLELHQVDPKGKVYQRFEHNGGQSLVDGIVIKDYAAMLPEVVHVMNPSTGKTYQLSSTEVINQIYNLAHFEKMGAAPPQTHLLALNGKGEWQEASPEAKALQPGLATRG